MLLQAMADDTLLNVSLASASIPVYVAAARTADFVLVARASVKQVARPFRPLEVKERRHD